MYNVTTIRITEKQKKHCKTQIFKGDKDLSLSKYIRELIDEDIKKKKRKKK